jgi:hypothetical protein
VHRKNILIHIYPIRCNVTQFILSGSCSTRFGWYHHTSSGAQTTVSTASGICHTVTATCRYQVPDAVDTVVSAPDDGWWYHPKHVEQFPDKINCVTLHFVGYILEYTLHITQTGIKLTYDWQVVLFCVPACYTSETTERISANIGAGHLHWRKTERNDRASAQLEAWSYWPHPLDRLSHRDSS